MIRRSTAFRLWPIAVAATLAVLAPSLVGQSGQAAAAPRPYRCPGLLGVWKGESYGTAFHGLLVLHVSAYPDGGLSGVLNVPTIWSDRADEAPLSEMRRDGQHLRFKMRERGLRPSPLPWTYTGTISPDGSTIHGAWTRLALVVPTVFQCTSRPAIDHP
jgi:hypothetical protein